MEITVYLYNIVFCCVAVPEEDGTMKTYYGADTVTCTRTARIADLVDLCFEATSASLNLTCPTSRGLLDKRKGRYYFSCRGIDNERR